MNFLPVLDTTLREGLQRVGTRLEPRVRRWVAEELLASGIAELEVGVVGRDGFLPALVAGLRHKHPDRRFWIWTRMRRDDLNEAQAMGAKQVAMCIPVSDQHLEQRLGWSRVRMLEILREQVVYARSLGLEVSVGLEDASRAPVEAVVEAATVARDAGATRVRFADTVGILTPSECAVVISRLVALQIQVGFHGHDDFGMATANAISALEAGATVVDASLLGWGERAGISATERIAGFYSVRKTNSVDLGRLCDCARELAAKCAVSIPNHAPVVGSHIFKCETGLHVAALAVSPSLYEPYAPELVGAQRALLVGAQAGAQSVQRVLGAVSPSSTVSAGLVSRVRRIAARLGRPLEAGELVKVAASD